MHFRAKSATGDDPVSLFLHPWLCRMARCAIVNSAITLWLTLCHLLAACAIMARRNKIRLMPSQHSTTEFSIMIKLAHFLNILRTASFKWTSLVVTNSLKLNGVNGKGDAKFHICKCAVDVHEEHNKVARGGGPKTFIRAIWRRATCGHINVGVVWAMFILFLPCAPSAPVGSVEYAKPCAPSAPVDSAEYAKQLEIAEAKISYAFSWQAYVIFSASIFAIGAVVLASCVLCVSIGCYGWMIAKDIANIRENQRKSRDERKAMCAQHQVVLGSTRKE